MKRIINFFKRKFYTIPKKEIIDPLEIDSPFDGTQKISEFIREAVDDIDSVIKHGYGLNMEDWITNCEVCLGGAVLLNRFDVKSYKDFISAQTYGRLNNVAYLFDAVRAGNRLRVIDQAREITKNIDRDRLKVAVNKWKVSFVFGQCNPEDIFVLKQSVYDLANCLQAEGL